MIDDERQPRKGDTVLYCTHALDDGRGLHWWRASIGFRRPDGTQGHAEWVTACAPCFAACDGDPFRVKVAGDGPWDGSALTFRAKS